MPAETGLTASRRQNLNSRVVSYPASSGIVMVSAIMNALYLAVSTMDLTALTPGKNQSG